MTNKYPNRRFHSLLALVLVGLVLDLSAQEYPKERPPRATPAAPEGSYQIVPGQAKQVIKGIGFEIQSDSIASGNAGLPEATTSAPHDLTPAERDRFADEMLKGFRYCRLAGGLYWRGTDPEGKYLKPRWPEQLSELKAVLDRAKVEGIAFEYWSPPPFWKANRQYTKIDKDPKENLLRCFGKDFANDPDYHGDTDRFLKDFAEACRQDVLTLREAGLKVVKWGLQNEPGANTNYSSCIYPQARATYPRAFLAVAPVIRALDPSIIIYADSWNLKFVQPVLDNPEQAKLVDWLAIHHIGSDAKVVTKPAAGSKPRFQNEYEYLSGPTTPARCLNTTLHIMNWFQIGEAPTWYWIHALKPIGNSEGSGYSLGFWHPADGAKPEAAARYPDLKPGQWTWNKYNWNAVGSFVKHMPWDCRAVTVKEATADEDLRILAFTRPNGKLTVVVANRSFTEHTFTIETGLKDATFKGFRYTPEEAGPGTMGVEIGTLTGGTIAPKVADMTWEFWEQQ